MLNTVLKLDFLQGRKTYIVGILMVLHGGVKVVLDALSGQAILDVDVQEIMTGLGFLALRKAM